LGDVRAGVLVWNLKVAAVVVLAGEETSGLSRLGRGWAGVLLCASSLRGERRRRKLDAVAVAVAGGEGSGLLSTRLGSETVACCEEETAIVLLVAGNIPLPVVLVVGVDGVDKSSSSSASDIMELPSRSAP
jgi:hypothetical protein